MLANPVGRVYAEALFGIAKEQGQVDEIGAELQAFLSLVSDDREIAGGRLAADPVYEKTASNH